MSSRGRARAADNEIKKGPWKAEEDEVLINHVNKYGPRDWSSIRSNGLLRRTGKSCRLRWVNKLRPNLKNGCKFSLEEERVVIELQEQFGNKWARIATYLPGRTDNDVKNFWSSRKKRLARVQAASSKPKKHNNNNNNTNSSSSNSNCNNNSGEEEDPLVPLITWQVGNEASSHAFGEQSSYVDQSNDAGLLGFTDPCPGMMNYNYNYFEEDTTTMMTMAPEMIMNVDCPAAHFPIQVPFDDPMMPPVLPVPLSPESQELVARLENGGFMNEFGPEDEAGDAGLDMTMMMMPPQGNCCAGGDNIDLAAPDSFFDDFPADMFDQIESLPSPSNW